MLKPAWKVTGASHVLCSALPEPSQNACPQRSGTGGDKLRTDAHLNSSGTRQELRASTFQQLSEPRVHSLPAPTCQCDTALWH